MGCTFGKFPHDGERVTNVRSGRSAHGVCTGGGEVCVRVRVRVRDVCVCACVYVHMGGFAFGNMRGGKRWI